MPSSESWKDAIEEINQLREINAELIAALKNALVVLQACNNVRPFGDAGAKAITDARSALAKATA